jgi:large subunit ribosomal protein L29
MKATDLRDRSTEDLAELERSITSERFQSKFKNFTNRLDDTSVIRKHKRDLARVKLILSERARGITVVGKPRDPAAPKRTPKVKPAPTPKVKAAAEPTGAKTKTSKAGAAEKKSKAAAAPKAAKKKASEKEETK